MRKAILGGVSACALILALGTAATAADFAPVEEPIYGWEGFYVGGHIGWGKADFEGSFKTGDTDERTPDDPRDMLVGAHAGYNFQMDSILFGIEVDASKLGWDESSGPGIDDFTAAIDTEVDWLASVRGRLGIAFEDFLLYATGGIAFTQEHPAHRFLRRIVVREQQFGDAAHHERDLGRALAAAAMRREVSPVPTPIA